MPHTDLHITAYLHSTDFPVQLEGGDLFHSKELFTVCEQTPGYTPIMLVAYRGDKVAGRLMGIVRRNSHSFLPAFLKRCVVYGTGEYASDENPAPVFRLLLNELTRWASQHSFLIEFRNLSDPLFGYRYFRENHYFPVNWLRIHNSLHNKHPEKRLSPSRRRQIRQALAHGATIQVAHTPEEFNTFFRLLKKYYATKIRKHFPGMEFFVRMSQEFPQKNIGQVFIIKYKGKIIGGSVCVFSGKDAYLWFSAGLRKSYPRQYPGILAVWAALDYAHRHGYNHMEFMDVGLPFKHYGYRDFILRFGGIQYGTRRWFRFRWDWLNRLITYWYI